jgi:signal transduction histidine kinase
LPIATLSESTPAETPLKAQISQQPLETGGLSASAEAQSLLARLMEVARASALEEMASGLAHELNQPLGAIATFSQAAERMLAKSPPMIDAAADALRQISKEALGAGDGIRRIRRIFNREVTEKQRCSLGSILRELEPLLILLGERSGAKLSIEIAPGVPDALADPIRIQHVLFTLIQNAFEACHGGTKNSVVTVTVGSDRYSVEVAVNDNGFGIPENAQAQIFRPFYTTKPKGTGLGLASSRAIVEMHEGTIGFKSTSEGSRFWFSLPAYIESKELA